MNSSEKLITLLKTLSKPPFEFGVTELSQVIGCGKSGTYKLLATLVQEGMAEQKENKKYRLGLAAYLIGKSYEDHVGLGRFARPYLEQLRDVTNENVSIAVWSEGAVTVLYRLESRALIRVVGRVGATRPINASAMGKTLAAYRDWDDIEKMVAQNPLEKYTPKTITDLPALKKQYELIREQGYAVSNGELDEGSMGIGAPVMDRNGNVRASISIGAPVIRVTEEKMQEFIRLVRKSAQQISEAVSSLQ